MDNETGSQEDVTTQDVETPQNDGFTLDGAVEEIRKLRKEAASNRVKAKEAEEAKTALETQLTEMQSKLSEAAEAQKLLGIEVQLAGKVIDTKKALRLVDDSYFTEGAFDVDRFLQDNAFLKPVEKPPVNNTPLNKGNNKPTEISATADNWFELLKQN